MTYDSPAAYGPQDPFKRSHMIHEQVAPKEPGTAIIIGIDPGKSGALAALDRHGRLLGVHDMPLTSSSNLTRPDGSAVQDVLLQLTDGDYRSAHVYIERAQGMKGQRGIFNYGCGFGVILGVLEVLCIPFEFVGTSWKRAAQLSQDKRASIHAARRLFPGNEFFDQVKRGRKMFPSIDIVGGRAEAALIARHGWLQRARQTA